MNVLDGVKKITVETDNESPIAVCIINLEDGAIEPILPSFGYRVRLTPTDGKDKVVERYD